MRILDVSPRVIMPLSGGNSIRMYNLLSRLSERHEVRQFSQARILNFRRRGFEKEKQITPSYREYRYGGLVGSPLCEIMERTGFGVPALCGYPLTAAKPRRLREWFDWADLVVVEFPWQYGYCRSIAKGKPLVLATHNVEAAKMRSGGKRRGLGRLWSAWIEALERRAVLDADLVLAVSPEDRDGFARFYGADPGKIAVIPNGADVGLYHPADEATRRALRSRLKLPPGPIVIFPAIHRKTPILEAMKWVRLAAALLPEVTFLITGAVTKHPRVEGNLLFTGYVNDFASYLRSADCLLCPIDRGGGTKIKVIEAAAAGLPIVAFTESVRGTTFHPGEHLLVAEKSAEALAAAVRLLLNEAATAQRMGSAARAHAVQHHDWGGIARTMESCLLGLSAAQRSEESVIGCGSAAL
jgi:glycosyltransferase involved in cell wall biosynthesis